MRRGFLRLREERRHRDVAERVGAVRDVAPVSSRLSWPLSPDDVLARLGRNAESAIDRGTSPRERSIVDRDNDHGIPHDTLGEPSAVPAHWTPRLSPRASSALVLWGGGRDLKNTPDVSTGEMTGMR